MLLPIRTKFGKIFGKSTSRTPATWHLDAAGCCCSSLGRDQSVRRALDDMFAGCWIGRGRSIAWAPRFVDINKLDIFLCGLVKYVVNKTPVRNLHELWACIGAALQHVLGDILNRTIILLEKLSHVNVFRIHKNSWRSNFFW